MAQLNRQITVLQRKVESVPSNVEITQFHGRLIELLDSMNNKSDENRKYCQVYNTVNQTQILFNQQIGYLQEI